MLTIALLGALPAGSDLIDAAKRGDVETVRHLIEAGADVHAAEGDGMTALHWAAGGGHLDVVEGLLRAGALPSATTRIGAYTPLHLAAQGGHEGVALALLDAGADPNRKTTSSGVTPLHLAAASVGGGPTAEILLERGADPNALEASAGQTPLMFAAAADRAETARVLLERGADPDVATRIIEVLPSMAINEAADRFLRKTIASYRAASGEDADWEPTAQQVQEAILAQRAYLLSANPDEAFDARGLVSERPDYPGGPDVQRPPYRETLVGATGGMTALLHAAREGHVAVAEVLVDAGADIDQVSGDGTSPLLIATLNGRFDLAMELVRWGANPNLAATTDGATPLYATLNTYWAPKSNYPQPRAQDRELTEYIDLVEALLDAGADPNVRLNTHLWYWEFGLTKLGIDLTGATPFWRAAFAQDVPAMKLLAAHGADPNIPTRWPAVGMRERRQQDGRQQEDSGLPWIPEGAPNAYPIHAAAGGGYLGLGAFSVRNVPDHFQSAVEYLLDEHDADINLRDSWGYTPLHYVASRGDNEMIPWMIDRGAEVSALTRLGQSTADMARGGRAGFFSRAPYPETVKLLQSLGSTLECLHTHFLDTGDYCAGAGEDDPFADQPGGAPWWDTSKRNRGGDEPGAQSGSRGKAQPTVQRRSGRLATEMRPSGGVPR